MIGGKLIITNFFQNKITHGRRKLFVITLRIIYGTAVIHYAVIYTVHINVLINSTYGEYDFISVGLRHISNIFLSLIHNLYSKSLLSSCYISTLPRI